MGQRDSRGHEARGQEDAGDRLWSLPETGQSCELPTHTHTRCTAVFEDLLGPQRVMTPQVLRLPAVPPQPSPARTTAEVPNKRPTAQIHAVSSAPSELPLVPSIRIKDRSRGLRAQRSFPALRANGVATKHQERPGNKNRPHGPLPKTLLQNKHTVTGGGIKTSATTRKFSQPCLQPAAAMHSQQIQTVFKLSPRRSAGTSKAITALMKAVCSLLTQRGHAKPPPRQLI